MEETHTRTGGPIIVIGGTGMLRSAVQTLTEHGNTVLAVSRNPGRGAPPEDTAGDYIPIQGQWAEPEKLVDNIRTALEVTEARGGKANGAIIWVHTPYRQTVLDQLERVLHPGSTVLQVWGSALEDPREVMRQEDQVDRPWRARHVFLGYQRDHSGSRWLTGEEISSAAVRAWEGEADQVTAGQISPWPHRP